MKRLTFVALLSCTILFSLSVLLFVTAPALAAYGTQSDCFMGCRPGNNSCTQCCSPIGQSCYSACSQQYRDCLGKCTWNDQNCKNDCSSRHETCRTKCSNIKYSFDCPDWVDPNHPCPYDCQVWNPASRSCVGAPMNGCK